MRKVQVQIEKRYVLSIDGAELSGRFKEINQMAGMRLLQNEKGKQIVLDFPAGSDINEVLASVLGDGEKMDASIVKASLDLLAEFEKVKKEKDNAGIRTERDGTGNVASEAEQAVGNSEHGDDSGSDNAGGKSVQRNDEHLSHEGPASLERTGSSERAGGVPGNVPGRSRRVQTEGGRPQQAGSRSPVGNG